MRFSSSEIKRPLADARRARDYEDFRHYRRWRTKQIVRTQGARRALHASDRGRRYAPVIYRRSRLTSSVRWRSERPPIVFEGEIRH